MPDPREKLGIVGRFAGSVAQQLALLIARVVGIGCAILIDDDPWTLGFAALAFIFGALFGVGRSKRDLVCLGLSGVGLVGGGLIPVGTSLAPLVMGLIVLIACFEVILALPAMLS